MKDVLALNLEARPWLPSASVTAGEVLNEYDVPLAGFLYSLGKAYLFANLVGDGQPLGVWAYAELNESDFKQLLAAMGPKDQDQAIEQAFANRPVTLAMVHDYQIAQIETLDSGIEGTTKLAQRFLGRLRNRLQRDSSQAHALAEDPQLVEA